MIFPSVKTNFFEKRKLEMSLNEISKPPYEIPLSDEHIMLMGKIAVIWGQIDEGLNTLLAWSLQLSPDLFESLIGNQMIGARVGHLKYIASNCSRDEVRELIMKVSDSLTKILPRRNAAMHGCWGRFPKDPSFTRFEIGIYNHQKPKVRFFSSEIPRLYNDMCAAMALIAEVLMYSAEQNPEKTIFNEQKIYFAPRPPGEKAFNLYSKRGDKIVRIESNDDGWIE